MFCRGECTHLSSVVGKNPVLYCNYRVGRYRKHRPVRTARVLLEHVPLPLNGDIDEVAEVDHASFVDGRVVPTERRTPQDGSGTWLCPIISSRKRYCTALVCGQM